MARIRPFRAVFYNTEKTGDLSNVVTRPYDVIDVEEGARLRAKHPCSFVNLILGKGREGGLHCEENYRRARELLDRWFAEKVFLRDESPCFYVYEQAFEEKGRRLTRRGVFCTVLLDELGKGDVYPHENTLGGPKEDRLKLMRSTRANLGPIFMLFPDDDKRGAKFIEGLAGGNPSLEFTDEFGVEHRIFRISDEDNAAGIQDLLEDKKLFIADGHHRYETAVNYRNERIASEGSACPESVRYLMTVCVPMSDEGLVILPTHRLIRGITGFKAQEFLEKCGRDFEINPGGTNPGGAEELLSRMEEYRARLAIGAYAKETGFVLLVLKDKKLLDDVGVASDALRNLDVTVLHKLVIEKALGLPPDERERIEYTHEEQAVSRLVDAGSFQLGLYLNATSERDIREVASRLEKMPPKSTFFYPKLSSGLIFNLLD